MADLTPKDTEYLLLFKELLASRMSLHGFPKFDFDRTMFALPRDEKACFTSILVYMHTNFLKRIYKGDPKNEPLPVASIKQGRTNVLDKQDMWIQIFDALMGYMGALHDSYVDAFQTVPMTHLTKHYWVVLTEKAKKAYDQRRHYLKGKNFWREYNNEALEYSPQKSKRSRTPSQVVIRNSMELSTDEDKEVPQPCKHEFWETLHGGQCKFCHMIEPQAPKEPTEPVVAAPEPTPPSDPITPSFERLFDLANKSLARPRLPPANEIINAPQFMPLPLPDTSAAAKHKAWLDFTLLNIERKYIEEQVKNYEDFAHKRNKLASKLAEQQRQLDDQKREEIAQAMQHLISVFPSLPSRPPIHLIDLNETEKEELARLEQQREQNADRWWGGVNANTFMNTSDANTLMRSMASLVDLLVEDRKRKRE
jgi:hypothetical protein